MSTAASNTRLPAFALLAGALSAAGLPIYIYAPKFYADNYGVSLTTLGALLFVLRVTDFAQDPLLGWISERLKSHRARAATAAGFVLAISMIGLFAFPPFGHPVLWFALTVTGLFTAFSFLTINFYAQGITTSAQISGGHLRLAAWRESGALVGICIAAIVPSLLMSRVESPFAIFAVGYALVTIFALFLFKQEWRSSIDTSQRPASLTTVLSDSIARRLLTLALINAIPLAVTSTLFLFFVESRLGAAGWEGVLLVLFFFAAALSAPAWSQIASKIGEKSTLLSAMVLAIVSFSFTLSLEDGDIWPFAVICIASGASIGADLTLLPAMFAKRMAEIAPNGGQGFGLWSLATKFSLAFAAASLLPALENAGFSSGQAVQPQRALDRLTILYALVPTALKFFSIFLLISIPKEHVK